MRTALVLAVVVVAAACQKPRTKHDAPAIVEEPVASTPSATPSADSHASAATEKPKTKFVSHMVNGKVEIEEVPIVDEPAPSLAPSAPPSTPDAPATTAAMATQAGQAKTAGPDFKIEKPAMPKARDDFPPKVLLEKADAETDLDRRIAMLEDGEKKLDARTPPAWRAAIFAAIGDAYDQENDGAQAELAYKDAADLSAGYTRVYEAVKKKHDAERYYTSVRNEHFVARFDGESDDDLARHSLELLDDARKSVGGKLDLFPSQAITVIFYTQDAYKNATAAPDWSGGLFDGKIRIPKGTRRLARGDEANLLTHEYTHALLATLPTSIPAWFHEGLAQHMEDGEPHKTLDGLKQPGGRAKLPTLTALRTSFSTRNTGDARIAYACALDIIDALVEWRGENALKDFVAAMKDKKSFDDAFLDVYGLTQDQLEAKWRDRFPS